MSEQGEVSPKSPHRAGALLLALVVLLAAACGGQGTLGAKALEQQSKAVQSLAAEGALLAQDSAAGKSTGIFRREHATELSSAASKTEASLASASTEPALEPEAARAHRAGGEGGRRPEAPRQAPPRPSSERSAGHSTRPRIRASASASSSHEHEERARGRARDHVGDRRLRRHRRSRVQHAGGRDVRVPVALGRRRRGGRDHRLLRDVRPCLGGLRAARLRPRARAGRLRLGAGDADRLRDRQPHDVRRRGGRRRDLLPAALGPALPPADPARGAPAGGDLLGAAFPLARAALRLSRPRPARVRGGRHQAQPRLAAGRARLRARARTRAAA